MTEPSKPPVRRLKAQLALELPSDWSDAQCHLYADGFASAVFEYMVSAGTIVYHIENEEGEKIGDPRPRGGEFEEWN